MGCTIDDTITHGCNFGLSPLVIISEMFHRKYLKLPSRLFFVKNEKFEFVNKYEIANFLGQEFGFSRAGGIKEMIVLLYNEKSIFHEIVEKYRNDQLTHINKLQNKGVINKW